MRERAQINKHQQRTVATRRKLLKAALRVFARDGFEAARIEDIAHQAGHTRGAFYANFETKEDLFFALLEQQISTHVNNLQQLLACCADPEERLQALREYYVKRIHDRQWVLLMVEFKLFALRHRRLHARLAGTHRRLRLSAKPEAIMRLLPARMRHKGDSAEACRAVLEAALNGLVLEHAYDPKRISEREVVSALRRIFNLLIPE